jgi:A/G-specific adenine glycosylase
MLQQTRIGPAEKYYVNFLEALPTMKDLAECPEEKLLKLWEGLGYYSRVRNMKKTARLAESLPEDYEALKKLPGIGNYTAAAVASIAFGIPHAAVDGNVLRAVSRLCGSREDVMQPAVRRDFEEKLTALLLKPGAPDPGTFNQAVMELGEIICLPNTEPLCSVCPVCGYCTACREGTAGEIPVRLKKTQRRSEDRTVLLFMDGEKTAIRKRPDTGLLAGLYEFPNETGHLTAEEASRFAEDRGYHVREIHPLPDAEHIFSHVEWHMKGYALLIERDRKSRGEDFLFADPAELRKVYAVPGAFAAYRKYALAEKNVLSDQDAPAGKMH